MCTRQSTARAYGAVASMAFFMRQLIGDSESNAKGTKRSYAA
ncbi:hypothetical protein ANAPC5_01015 [Anaplasma phagocytophilum]|nr:hypothetical protein ANAPC2_01232 [Anaplasma phagocytophilum]SBO33080.1 hypothetical protein ANAPC3_01094 [Anaplasma phagocytophilum]SBO33595.1 hypothetical protein ANAPC4_01219 [Anaplasma phagocytophilum]SCV64975.1 hypothetical protein ANAPC5_01015 [Anaplasma phagocytophilum]SCV66348.1 hypothetical protein ANAPH2_01559 [Anaplasma phagocytophilum]